ncbi:hypothetical protein Tco_0311848 [Tanacetum coccineum]
MSENLDRYHDNILDLEAKLKKNVDLMLKLGNSLQGMFMLGPKPLSVYDPQLKHGLGDTEDTLDDASNSQQKMKEKMNDPIAVANKENCWKIDYQQINALYKDFVPQKELSAEQKYFPSSFIPSDKTSNATSSIPRQSIEESPLDHTIELRMRNENVSLDFIVQSLMKERDNVKIEYQKLFDSIKKTRSQSQKEMDELIAHVSEKTYAYGAIRAENQNLLSTISELKTRLETVEKGKSVNTKFDMTNVSQNLLCVTPLNKQVFQKKTVVSKTKEKHVVSKPVTLQTSPDKQRGANSNKNVIVPGMYRVVTTQESQTNKAKSDLSSTGMNVASSVRRPMNRDSHVKNSILANSKNSAKNVAVYVRKNKQINNTSANVISNKENVNDVNVANAAKAKTLLCVSCMQNVLIPCHDNCLAKYKLNVHSNVRRDLSTNSRTPRSSNTTNVVLKTMFSEKLTQSKSLDTISIVSKHKIDVESASKAKHKVVQLILWIVDSGCSKHMTGD